MNKIKIYTIHSLALLFVLSFTSCEDLMDVNSTTGLPAGDHYSSKSEIYGAFIGLGGSFAQVADQTIILAGLKGDLMEPTANAPEEFWDIYKFQADNNTAYTSSKKYYDIVLNCNDFLRRVKKYNQDVPGDIPIDTYKGMISSAINYKVWSWLTIGKFWGEAAIYSTNMIDNSTEGVARIELEHLPQYLMDYMNGGEDGINAFNELDWKGILDPISDDKTDVNWVGINLDGRILMGELNLWAGNYQEAIDYLTKYIQETEKVGNASFSWMFTKKYTNVMNAVATVVPFSAAYGQEHNLLKFFSPISPNLYYFAPTDIVVDLFGSQVRKSYGLGDNGRGASISYGRFGSEYYISKYMRYESNEENGNFVSDAYIYIYRISELNLMISEAYCLMGKLEESLAFLDEGIDDFWTGSSFRAPFEGYDQIFQKNNGIRDRAGLLELNRDSIFHGCDIMPDPNRASMRVVAGLIADEIALEHAYEGKRWPALVRMATNLGDPTFLSEKVSRKFGDDGAINNYKAILDDRKNWFIQDVVNDSQK